MPAPHPNGLRRAACLAAIAAAAPLAATALAGAPDTAATDVFKCRGVDGTPVYQEAPCNAGRELRDFGKDPANVSVIPFRDGTAAPAAPTVERARRATRDPGARPARAAPRAAGDPAERRHVREGMSEGEVLARLGAPDATSGKSGKVRWSYLPAPGDPATLTTIRLEQGHVVAVERRIVR